MLVVDVLVARAETTALLPYLLDALTIFIAVILADLVLDRLHRHARRRRMRELNKLSHEARARRRAVVGQ